MFFSCAEPFSSYSSIPQPSLTGKTNEYGVFGASFQIFRSYLFFPFSRFFPVFSVFFSFLSFFCLFFCPFFSLFCPFFRFSVFPFIFLRAFEFPHVPFFRVGAFPRKESPNTELVFPLPSLQTQSHPKRQPRALEDASMQVSFLQLGPPPAVHQC